METLEEPIKEKKLEINDTTNVSELRFDEKDGNRYIEWQVENRQSYDWVGIYKSSSAADDDYITWTYVKPWLSSQIAQYSTSIMNDYDQLEARYFSQANIGSKATVIKRVSLKTTLNTKIFDNPPFAEDEFFKDRPSTGLCFSGGGSRAMILAMGQLRGIEKLDLAKNVKYISSVSGGSWASTAYAYRLNDDTKNLLGEYIQAKDIKVDSLENNPLPQMASVNKTINFDLVAKKLGIAESYIGNFKSISPFILNYLFSLYEISQENITQFQGWQNAVARSFLAPFGLLDKFESDHFTLNDQTIEEFKKVNSEFEKQNNKIFTQNKNSPYLIVNGVITNEKGTASLTKNYVGIEFTPLYSGTGYRANNFLMPFGKEDIKIGNGAIQSLSFGGVPTSKIEDNQIKTLQASSPLGLGAITGVSSNFLGGIISTELDQLQALIKILQFIWTKIGPEKVTEFIQSIIDELAQSDFPPIKITKSIIEAIFNLGTLIAKNPKTSYWSPNSTPDAIPKYGTFELADGGCMDNYGIMPMLRRQVKKVVVFINSDQILSMEAIPESGKVDASFMELTLPSLFNCLSSSFIDIAKLGIDVSNNHVLESSGFEEVVSKLQDAKKKNQTVMATTKHTTVKNDWWGIDPYEVEICWIYNDIVPNFEEELPNKTQEYLQIGKYRSEETTTAFPLYDTKTSTMFGFLRKDAAMLGHMGAWNVVNNEKEFEAILKA